MHLFIDGKPSTQPTEVKSFADLLKARKGGQQDAWRGAFVVQIQEHSKLMESFIRAEAHVERHKQMQIDRGNLPPYVLKKLKYADVARSVAPGSIAGSEQ